MDPQGEGGTRDRYDLPEWETTSRHRGEKPPARTFTPWGRSKARIAASFNFLMPPKRRYCGLSKKTTYIILFIVLLAIIALIIGLAVGLSNRSRYATPQERVFDAVRGVDRILRSHHQTLPLGSQTYTGDLTYYSPGLGACGITSSDNDNIVSISHTVFDAASKGSNPNANPLCKHKIRALREGSSVDLTVVDRCDMHTSVPCSELANC